MDYEKKYKDALERARNIRFGDPNSATANVVCEEIFPELKESEDERIKKAVHIYLDWLDGRKDYAPKGEYSIRDMIAWLEKQGEQKETYKTEPFEIEHGKYYYCIKDYYGGGKKWASKGDVVQALRGLPIMSLKDASEYFLPVNNVQNSAWSEEDEDAIGMAIKALEDLCDVDDHTASFVGHNLPFDEAIKRLKVLKPQPHWKPTQEQMSTLYWIITNIQLEIEDEDIIKSLYNDLKKL